MDNLNIKSKFLLGILSKVIGRAITKSTGYNVILTLTSVEATAGSDDNLDVDVEGSVKLSMSKDQLSELTNGLL